MHAFALDFLDCTEQVEPDRDIDVPIAVAISPTKAQLRLITRLKNQREFTQTADLGGENEGGVATGEGVEVRVTFGSART
jgi:hypothetical protein